MKHFGRHLLYVGPGVAAFLLADHLLSEGRSIGWERNCVVDARQRWQRAPDAEGAVLLGSSTSVDWLTYQEGDLAAAGATTARTPTEPSVEAAQRYLGRLLKVAADSVVDAHINGCHQGCTYAQVRRLLHERRRFRFAILGTNQFQLCEHLHSKRVLQHRMLIPLKDTHRLLPHYFRTEQPLTYVARYLGGALSGAYADTAVLQRRWADRLFGSSRTGREHRWYRSHAPPPRWTGHCAYRPEQVQYKRRLSAALLGDLGQLAEHVLLLLLPDENLERDDVDVVRAWAAHRTLHRQLARERSHVTLVDLSQEGAQTRDHFRDGVHVNAWGARLQQGRFERELRRLRLIPVR